MKVTVAEQSPSQGYTPELFKLELGPQHNPPSFKFAHPLGFFVVGWLATFQGGLAPGTSLG